jgi:hypothetical protein
MFTSKRISCAILLLTFLGVGLIPAEARAGFLTFTGSSGTDADSPFAASAVFTPGNGFIQVVLSNTQSGNSDSGVAVSGLFFSVANGLPAPTGISSLSGTTIDFSNNNQTATVTKGNPSDYDWGFAVQNSQFGLINGNDNGLTGPGDQPNYLIIGPNPDTSNGQSLTGPHNPFFDGSITFILTAPGVTTNTVLDTTNITNVSFTFGSDSSGTGVMHNPAPPSIILLGIGGLCFGIYLLWSRRRPQTVAA